MTRRKKRGATGEVTANEDPTERTVVDTPEYTDEYATGTLTQPDFHDDDVLTDDDIDAPTVERDAPPELAAPEPSPPAAAAPKPNPPEPEPPSLPRFEMTGTVTLPRTPSTADVPDAEPATLRKSDSERPLPERLPAPRLVPPPKPARSVPPAPRRASQPVISVETESEYEVPTPIQRISSRPPAAPSHDLPPPPRLPRMTSSPPPPPVRPASAAPPPPPPRASSAPLPPPPRAPSGPLPPPPRAPSAPPPPAPRAVSAPPPPLRPPSAPPPRARAPSLPPKPTPPRAPPSPAPPRVQPSPVPPRPLPPAPAQRAPHDDTRPFPLQAPERAHQPSAKPAASHAPVPLTTAKPARRATQARTVSPQAAPTRVISVPSARAQYAHYQQAGLTVPPREAPPLVVTHRRRRAMERNAYAAAVGVFGALAVSSVIGAILVFTLRPDADETQRPRPAATTPIGTPAPTVPVATAPTRPLAPVAALPCRLQRGAARIAGPAMPNVLPMVAEAPGARRIAVGYASSKDHAEGIVVHLDDATVESRYSEEFSRPVQRVTPLTDRAPVAFAVDSDDAKIRAMRTVAAHPPFRVGVSFFGFVRINQGVDPTVVWPGGRFENIGEPMFALTDRDGYGVTFRAGKGSGDVFAGWLTASGTADGELVRIEAGPREVGAPAIAANDKSVVVVFAARGIGEPWRLFIARADRGKAPNTSRPLDVSIPGAGDAISPSIVALRNGGFVVQWLEGPSSTRRVVARTLDAELRPLGLPVELSSHSGIQDTPGALAVRDDSVLAVHLTATDRQVDLWGAVLSCP